MTIASFPCKPLHGGDHPERVYKDVSVPVQWFLAIGFYFATFLAVAQAVALEEEESATSQTSQMVNVIHATSAVLQALQESRQKRSRSSDDDDDDDSEERPQKRRYGFATCSYFHNVCE